MAKEKHMSSKVHHRAETESVVACVSTGHLDMVVAIIGAASLILNVVHAANKDAAAHTPDPYLKALEVLNVSKEQMSHFAPQQDEGKDEQSTVWDGRHAKMRKLLTDVTSPEQQ
uniref:Uncharacterized protein n=1 Tax=Tanacetum cinerariifolium TaxID=118510 RepID=A0A699J5Q9_TANCI|nr:hypothetical protein [Tanacetum cinerariifolium]